MQKIVVAIVATSAKSIASPPTNTRPGAGTGLSFIQATQDAPKRPMVMTGRIALLISANIRINISIGFPFVRYIPANTILIGGREILTLTYHLYYTCCH